MRIQFLPSDGVWWGLFLDRAVSCFYIAPFPGLLLLVAWGPQFDTGHMKFSGLVARRDRLTGRVEELPPNRPDAWRSVHPITAANFKPGSPSRTEKQP